MKPSAGGELWCEGRDSKLAEDCAAGAVEADFADKEQTQERSKVLEDGLAKQIATRVTTTAAKTAAELLEIVELLQSGVALSTEVREELAGAIEEAAADVLKGWPCD